MVEVELSQVSSWSALVYTTGVSPEKLAALTTRMPFGLRGETARAGESSKSSLTAGTMQSR